MMGIVKCYLNHPHSAPKDGIRARWLSICPSLESEGIHYRNVHGPPMEGASSLGNGRSGMQLA
jgi:hypothetical protein